MLDLVGTGREEDSARGTNSNQAGHSSQQVRSSQNSVLASEGTFTLDPIRKPKEIDETITAGPNRGKVFKGIYEIDETHHTICFGAAGSERPTDFSAKPGSGRVLQVWRREQEWAQEKRPHVEIRGIYGGIPDELMKDGKTLADCGINAVWIGSGALTTERVALLRQQGARVFAEFNTMHVASYLKDHPDAAPIGSDGKVCPPPHGWQGICPTHPGYRESRMEDFRRVLRDFAVDGIWLDYHHSHASWEQAVPDMPDTCFCQRCLAQFSRETGTKLSGEPVPRIAEVLLRQHADTWVQWRCDVFTDWVREFRAILDETRPKALLGTFHCPWTDTDFDGALRKKLAIDLNAQARYLDVFSIMPYHARFGHAADPAWISRQTAWLGSRLGVKGDPGERHKIWPIVQLADWGEAVSLDQVRLVLDHGTRRPATGVMVFAWGGLSRQRDKVEAMVSVYRAVKP